MIWRSDLIAGITEPFTGPFHCSAHLAWLESLAILPERACQEEKEHPLAGNILEELGMDEKLVERVKFVIGNHNTYENIDGIDFQIIIEADFFDSTFEKGLSEDSVTESVQKHFKTYTGKKLIQIMYLQK